jgi:thiol-disulfide isomerase/thioredoxin
MRVKLLLFFFICGRLLFAQEDCFKNCRERSTACWENLKARGITSTDSALACDNLILQKLKACSFPELNLNNYDGGTLNTGSLKGNVVFVHFWFTTCATCIAEMPLITRLSNEYKNKNVKFLAISFNDHKTLEAFFKKRGNFGCMQTSLEQKVLEKEFCILSGYPMNLVLDKNGKVIEAWVEENPESDKQEGFYSKTKQLIENSLLIQ